MSVDAWALMQECQRSGRVVIAMPHDDKALVDVIWWTPNEAELAILTDEEQPEARVMYLARIMAATHP